MVLSEQIARLIEEMLEEQGGCLDLRRNELATRLGCVPSQINYVITSRFSPNHGYRVESRRGGGGYVRITRMQFDPVSYLRHCYHCLPDTLSEREALSYLRTLLQNDAITEEAARILRSTVSEEALSPLSIEDRPTMRAHLFKTLLLTLSLQNH